MALKSTTQSNIVRPAFPRSRAQGNPVMLVHNEGTRSLYVIGDGVPDNARIVPGGSLEIALSPSRRVQLTVYDGGVQIDCVDPAENRGAHELRT